MKTLNSSSPLPAGEELTPFERECISVFVHGAQALSIPRSVAEIYGLLFGSFRPLAMDDIVARLRISKGSASQGLRWLREVHAVRTIYVAGDRRDHFAAETELRKLAGGFLRESLEPRLDRGLDHLDRVKNALPHDASEEMHEFAQGRLAKLRRWHRFGAQLLPLLLRVASKF